MSTPPQAHAEESPRRAATGSPLTPEQLARIERNRREALVRQTNNARGRRQLTASTANETVSALVHSPVSALPPSMAPLPETTLLEQRTTTAQPAIAPSKLQPAPTFARWYDYDLSTLKDSKGGFLYDEQPTGSSGTTSDHTNARKRGRYDVKSDDTRPPTTVIYPHEMVPGVSHESPLDAAESSLGPNGDVRAHQTAWTTQRCRDCTTSPDLDADMLRYFRVRVCRECRDRDASRYTLLTKTEAKEDYLLTDEELRDEQRMPHWERPNPRKSTYARMKLYLREQVESFAFAKWNGAEGLDAEYARRVAEKSRKKEREYARKLQDLRRRTRVSLYLAEATTGGNGRNDDEVVPSSSMVGGTGRRATPHEHVFRDDDNGADADGETVRQCTLCGLAVVVDEF